MFADCIRCSFTKKNINKDHKSKQEQWVVVSTDGNINFFTLRRTRTMSINRFMTGLDKDRPSGKWKHWYRKGYRCVKVKVQIEKI